MSYKTCSRIFIKFARKKTDLKSLSMSYTMMHSSIQGLCHQTFGIFFCLEWGRKCGKTGGDRSMMQQRPIGFTLMVQTHTLKHFSITIYQYHVQHILNAVCLLCFLFVSSLSKVHCWFISRLLFLWYLSHIQYHDKVLSRFLIFYFFHFCHTSIQIIKQMLLLYKE